MGYLNKNLKHIRESLKKYYFFFLKKKNSVNVELDFQLVHDNNNNN